MEAAAALSSASKLSFRHSSPSPSAKSSSRENRDSRTNTPLSSICDETRIDLGWFFDKTASASDDDFVMIDTLENGLLHQLDHISSDSQGFVSQHRAYSRILNNRVGAIEVHQRMHVSASTTAGHD